MSKILKGIDILLKTILSIIVAAFIIIVFTQVIARYVFNHSLSWSEELARVLFTQMIFLGTPLVILEKRTIAVDILMQYLPKSAKRYLYLLIHLLSIIFFSFLAYSGFKFATGNMNQVTTALRINIGMLNMVIPISAVLMILNTLRAGYDDFTNTYAPDKEAGEVKVS